MTGLAGRYKLSTTVVAWEELMPVVICGCRKMMFREVRFTNPLPSTDETLVGGSLLLARAPREAIQVSKPTPTPGPLPPRKRRREREKKGGKIQAKHRIAFFFGRRIDRPARVPRGKLCCNYLLIGARPNSSPPFSRKTPIVPCPSPWP